MVQETRFHARAPGKILNRVSRIFVRVINEVGKIADYGLKLGKSFGKRDAHATKCIRVKPPSILGNHLQNKVSPLSADPPPCPAKDVAFTPRKPQFDR